MTGAPDTRGEQRAGFLPVLPRAAWVVLGGDFVSAIGSGLTLPCLFIYAHRAWPSPPAFSSARPAGASHSAQAGELAFSP